MPLYSSNTTISIPGNAKNITMTVAGASGASGQSGYNSAGGGVGRVGTFTFPDYTARTLTLDFTDNGGSGGGGGTTSYTYTVSQTCTGTATATSTISAVWDLYNSGNNARMIVSGTGSASIGIQCEVSDDPNTAGTCFNNFSCNGINFSFPSDGSTNNTKFATFSAGTYNASISGLQRPIQLQNSSKQLSLRDGDGEDENGSFTITGITQNQYSYSYTYDCSYTATGYYYGGQGGKGGRSASVFDSFSGSTIVVAGGGGGGGAGSTSGASGSSGGNAGSWVSGTPSETSGGNGSQSNTGGGGGGGGGSSGGSGGGSRTGGGGGGSVYRSAYVSYISQSTNSGSAYIDISWTLVFPSIVSFTSNKSSVINNGESATLSWSTTNGWSATITGGGLNQSVGVNSSLVVTPTFTTTYTLTVNGPGGTTTTANVTIIVYQPPILTFTLDRNPIIRGESTILRWNTTGDASTITWSSGGIVNGNLTSNATVSPTQNTTYSATVSGLGGSNSKSITLIVYQPPTATITVPNSLLYSGQGTIQYTSTYSNSSLTIVPTYQYDVDGAVTGTTINLTKPTSAEFGVGTTSVSGSITTAIPYNTRGPRSATYLITAVGSGGTATASATITIIIDETPNNVLVPDTEDVYKDQDPLVTPDATVTSEVITVSDIDIPVEVKSDHPIQVDINNENIWRNLRQIT